MTILSPDRGAWTTFDTFLHLVAHAGTLHPAPSPGSVLDGNYALIERLARGGMATVYRAHDRARARDVAIKFPDAARGGSRLIEMFEREAQITARLRHPGIVEQLHAGRYRGVPYVVLELLDGETLADRLARLGPLAAGEAVAMLDGVLDALAYVHGRGVVHRDVTPRNVFLCTGGRIKLLDFGVAIDRERGASTITRGAGTRGYMPPEHHGDTDPRGDLWAAGVLFVESVAGVRPEPDAGWLVPASVPRRVRRVVKRALSRDRDRRPATASAMRLALGAPREVAGQAVAGGWW